MRRVILLSVFCVSLLSASVARAQGDYISPKIRPLVKFIKQTNTSPVDYVMGLFEKYDVVVLGERDHRDITQYDLIEQIISDQRFIENVGHVITEVGVSNMTDELNEFMKRDIPDSLVEVEIARLAMNLDYFPLWEKTNYYTYLASIYRLNRTLSDDRKIWVAGSDNPFSWRQTKDWSPQDEAIYQQYWGLKDIAMGYSIVTELYKIFDSKQPRKKALIILNTPHSLYYQDYKRGVSGFCAYRIIADHFPRRTANVMINWAKSSDDYQYVLSNDGRIDAAFAACDYKSIGFDIQSSPLVKEPLEVHRIESTKDETIRLNDVYHGFIYYKSPFEWKGGMGVPGLDRLESDSLKRELARRAKLWHNKEIMTMEDNFKLYSTVRSFDFIDRKTTEYAKNQIEKYYKPGSRKE